MTRTHRFDPRHLAMLLAVVFAAASPVHADVNAAWADTTTYFYEISHVPDLDQRRFLVPNGGNMYCVPTSAMNWVMYFANHGASSLAPGPGNWQSQTLYTTATGAIIDMGILMQTDAVDGTDGTDGPDGLRAWLGNGNFNVVHQSMNYTWTPRFQNMSEAVFNGAYVMPVVGWYNEFKFEPDIIQRVGGHALSMNGGARSGNNMEISWRDPARDEGSVPVRLIEQSIFATEEYGLEPRQRRPYMNGARRDSRTMEKVLGYGSAYLDGYYAIYPLFALAPQPESEGFLVAKAWSNTLSGSLWDHVIDRPYEGPLASITLHPDMQHMLYTNATGLHVLNPVTGSDELVDVGLIAPSSVIVGRKRGVYVVDDTQIVCINIDVEPPVVEASTIAPEIPGAMAYDDANDRLLVLAPFAGKIMSYTEQLSGEPQVIDVSFLPMSEDAQIAWDPAAGACWLVSAASDTAYYLQWDSDGNVIVSGITNAQVSEPSDIQVGDDGRVFIVAGNAVHQFDPTGDGKGRGGGGGWAPASEPFFADMNVGKHFMLSRSRSNFDPDIHTPEQWQNELPEDEFGTPIPDCVADITGDGTVDIQDLFALLAKWGQCTGTCYEDVNADDTVDINDLFVLLANWGECP